MFVIVCLRILVGSVQVSRLVASLTRQKPNWVKCSFLGSSSGNIGNPLWEALVLVLVGKFLIILIALFCNNCSLFNRDLLVEYLQSRL